MSVIRAAIEKRDLWSAWGGWWPEDPTTIPSPSEGWTSWAGVTVTEMAALQQITVLSCVGLIADTVSTLPIAGFRKIEGFPQRIEPDPPLLQNPHPEMDIIEWLGQLLFSLLLRGNGYGEVLEFDKYGFPRYVLPLHPDKIRPIRDRETGRKGYKVGGGKQLSNVDVVHLKGLPKPGSLEGIDPIAHARNSIGTTLAAEEFGARFFSDGAHPSGLLKTDQPIDQNEAREFQARWIAAHGGRHRKPAVMGKGLGWEPLSLKPDEAQFLQTIRAKRAEICGFYRVPPHMVGDVERSTSWGTGIEEQMLGFVTFTLGIWIRRMEVALSALLPKGQYVKFNVAGLLRGRLTERFKAYMLGRQGGWLNIDEIRALEEYPPLPDGAGQLFSQPLNWGPIPTLPGMEEEPEEPPPPEAPPSEPS